MTTTPICSVAGCDRTVDAPHEVSDPNRLRRPSLICPLHKRAEREGVPYSIVEAGKEVVMGDGVIDVEWWEEDQDP